MTVATNAGPATLARDGSAVQHTTGRGGGEAYTWPHPFLAIETRTTRNGAGAEVFAYHAPYRAPAVRDVTRPPTARPTATRVAFRTVAFGGHVARRCAVMHTGRDAVELAAWRGVMVGTLWTIAGGAGGRA